MEKSRGTNIGRMAGLYSALYLIVFLIFYIPNYVFEDYFINLPNDKLDAFLFFRSAAEKAVQYFVPVSAAAVLLLRSAERGIGSIFLPSLTMSLSSLVYALPYCYLYALSLGYDSVEGLLISLGLSAVGVVLVAASIVALTLVARTAAGILIGKSLTDLSGGRRLALQRVLWNSLTPDGAFSLSSPLSCGIFASGLTVFLIQTVTEIISVVSFFAEDGAYFEIGDIIYIACTFIFLLLELVGCHAACYFISKKIKEKDS